MSELTDRQPLDQLRKKFVADAIHYADSEICDALRIGEIRGLFALASAHLDLREGLKSGKLFEEFCEPREANVANCLVADFNEFLLKKLEEK